MNAKTKMIGLAILLLVIFALVLSAYYYSPAQASSGSAPVSSGSSIVLPTRNDFLKQQQPKALDSPKESDSPKDISVLGIFASFTPPPQLNKPQVTEGFDNILNPALVGSDPEISPLSKFSGNPSCFNKSFGLSNSTGALCLDDKTFKLLTTRGGNASSN